MSDALNTKYKKMETAYEIMESLQGMFGRPSDQAKYEAVKKVMNYKIKAGTSIRAHVLMMISTIHEAEINRAIIDEGIQVGMILESLSPHFLQFKSNYFMNKLSYNLTQLLNKLTTFESISVEKKGEANVVEPSTSNSSSKKRKRNKKKGKSQGTQKAVDNDDKKNKANNNQGNKKSSTQKKPKGKCFHCGIDGHRKRNYK